MIPLCDCVAHSVAARIRFAEVSLSATVVGAWNELVKPSRIKGASHYFLANHHRLGRYVY
jgi:hypothetical protein